MNKIGIITSHSLPLETIFSETDQISVSTPYGETDGKLRYGLIQGRDVVMLVRNSDDGRTPPHKINYRANVWAMHAAKVDYCFALSPATGIRADLTPGVLVVPTQLIDYTHSREHTFFEDGFNGMRHFDFQQPYSAKLRDQVIAAAGAANITINDEATYAVAQGPRLETLAEINRMERDGCDFVGMSGMPETILARELAMEYVAINIITDKAAGRGASLRMSADLMSSALKQAVQSLQSLISQVIFQLEPGES